MPLLCSILCPDAHTAAVVAGERVHVSAIAPDLGVGALILVDARSFPFRSPFSFLGARSSSSGQNRAESPPFVAPATARRPASIRRTPSCAASPSTHSDHPRARPSPYPGRIEHRRHPPSLFPSSFAIAVELLSPAILRPKSTHGEPNCGLLLLPDLFPTRIGAAAVESKPRRRRTRRPSPAHAAGPPCTSPCAAAARPRSA